MKMLRPMSEIQFTKYLPFKVDGNVASGKSLMAVIDMVDTNEETGVETPINFRINLGGRSNKTFDLSHIPGYHTTMMVDPGDYTAKGLCRGISFSNNKVHMGNQFQGSVSTSIPLFSTLVKFLKFVIQKEALLPLTSQTAIFVFSPVSGGRDGNARQRVYDLVGRSMEQEGLGIFLSEHNSQYGREFLLMSFVDKLVEAGYLEHM
jgi:hypothetical protein